MAMRAVRHWLTSSCISAIWDLIDDERASEAKRRPSKRAEATARAESSVPTEAKIAFIVLIAPLLARWHVASR